MHTGRQIKARSNIYYKVGENMMNNRKVSLVLLIFVSLLAGCSSTGGKNATKPLKMFRINLGLAMQDDFYQAIEMIVYGRYRYIDSGDSHSSPNNLELVTEWRPRFILDDEKELGIVVVWSRILLTAKLRPGQASFGGESTYRVTMRAESRVKYSEYESWQPGPLTTQARNYFRDIADDLLQELKKPY